jgi:hypothetical protein
MSSSESWSTGFCAKEKGGVDRRRSALRCRGRARVTRRKNAMRVAGPCQRKAVSEWTQMI